MRDKYLGEEGVKKLISLIKDEASAHRAYEIAHENGYDGTEEEFFTLLGNLGITFFNEDGAQINGSLKIGHLYITPDGDIASTPNTEEGEAQPKVLYPIDLVEGGYVDVVRDEDEAIVNRGYVDKTVKSAGAGMLYNAYFLNPINSSGKSVFTGAGKIINGWETTSNAAKITIDDGLIVTSSDTTSSVYIRQIFDRAYPAGTYTFGLLVTECSGTGYMQVGYSDNTLSSPVLINGVGLFTCTVNATKDVNKVYFQSNANSTLKFAVGKLEEGSTSSAAYLIDDIWVPNVLPSEIENRINAITPSSIGALPVDGTAAQASALATVTVTSGTVTLADYRTPGVYYFSSNATITDSPSGGAGWLFVIGKGTEPLFKQIWTRSATTDESHYITYIRLLNSTTTTQWKRFAMWGDALTNFTGTLPINQGGTGQTTAPLSLYALVNGASALTSTTLATGDYVALGDVSDTTGKKITVANLMTYIANNVGGNISKAVTGKYGGTGGVGSGSPTKLTLTFEPQLLIITEGASANCITFFIKDAPYGYGVALPTNSFGTTFAPKVTWDGKEVSWYTDRYSSFISSDQTTNNNPAYQMNKSSTQYYYIAIA